MSYKKLIRVMKKDSLKEAVSISLPIVNTEYKHIGKLVPVGEWILDDKQKIQSICDWRQRSMKMFLTQFNSTYQKTFEYLKNFSIGLDNRLLFFIYDSEDKVVGHIGISEVDSTSVELDNLMRGAVGGDPRLIYFSEITLLNWCFTICKHLCSDVKVLSYNGMVLSLHKEVGYREKEKISLKKIVKGGDVTHKSVCQADSNVKYTYITMSLQRENFYKNAGWLKNSN